MTGQAFRFNGVYKVAREFTVIILRSLFEYDCIIALIALKLAPVTENQSQMDQEGDTSNDLK